MFPQLGMDIILSVMSAPRKRYIRGIRRIGRSLSVKNPLPPAEGEG